jgi:hypothetical protein
VDRSIDKAWPAGRFARLGVCAVAIAIAGCGKPTMGTVDGTLLYKGRPVPKALVKFITNGHPIASGMTDEAGHFKLTTVRLNDGAFAGPHTVVVEPILEMQGDVQPNPHRPDIPTSYQSHGTSSLTADIVAGKNNVVTLDLGK